MKSGCVQQYREFYDRYKRENGEPPAARDWSGDRNKSLSFRAWANRNNLPLRRVCSDGNYYIRLANRCEPCFKRGLSPSEAAEELDISPQIVKVGYWMLEDDEGDVEDDPRACEPPEVKELCDELRARDCIPPRLLPEEWPRYLEVRKKREERQRKD